MLKIAKTLPKLTAFFVTAAGGTLVGLLVGWNTAPICWDASQAELGWVGAVGGLMLAGLGCYFALERAEARARNRMQALVVKRLLGIAPRQ